MIPFPMYRSTVRVKFLSFFLCLSTGATADVYLTEGTNISVDVATDGRTAMDLLGGIWVLPADGGEASALNDGLRPARRPRWSPNDDALVYQASTPEHDEIWLHPLGDERSERLGNGQYFDQHPDWHPDGERVVFSSSRDAKDTGFDLWEIDVPTRLSWRLSHLPGNETEPAWSADGRSLTYVHELDGRWSVMLRRNGRPDVAIVSSASRLAAPSWRPDGSLITYMQHDEDGWLVRMAILSEPILDRPIIESEDLFIAPVAWLDRQQMLYAANGHIRKRRFNSRTSINIPFRAVVGKANGGSSTAAPAREPPAIARPQGKTVIRAARLYDGISGRYRDSPDIIIEGGRIVGVEDRADRSGAILVDLSDLTVLPGYIDAYGSLPADADGSLGPLLLGLGVTTLVADYDNAEAMNEIWSGKDVPGPRILPARSIVDLESDTDTLSDAEMPWLITVTGDMSSGVAQREAVRGWQSKGVAVLADSWQVGLGSGASLLTGAGTMPSSPGGRSYQDVQMARGTEAISFVSGLADISTPGLDTIMRSRLAVLLPTSALPVRRFVDQTDLSAAATTVVLGSKPNGLQPGIALHAELRALIKAGLSPEQALKAAGVNAATALGLGLRLGRVATGAEADLVLVDGDPLRNIGDALKIIGVVRNGRFFSVSGLIERSERARSDKSVE
jgi:hypothetical protein